MRLYSVISVVVPAAFALLMPSYMPRREVRYRWLLYLACGLFFISWYVPSPTIDGQSTSFMKHLIGGGMFTGVLWIYITRSFAWKSHWWVEAASLFALVSALGAINELAELILVKAGLAKILLTDTNWDLLANTLGALLVYIMYAISKRIFRHL